MELLEMTVKQKCEFCLEIVELVKNQITSVQANEKIEKALLLCRKWLNDYSSNISFELYSLIDNEEGSFTIFQEEEDDNKLIETWNCIIDSFAFICRQSYEMQGEKYFPEPIELVDNNTLCHLVDSFLICYDNDQKELNKILEKIK